METYRLNWKHVVIADAAAIATCLILVHQFIGLESIGILPAIVSPVLSVIASAGIVMWANSTGWKYTNGPKWDTMNDEQKAYACSVMGLYMTISVAVIGCAVPMVMLRPMGILWFILLLVSGIAILLIGVIKVYTGQRIGNRTVKPKSATAVWGLFILLLLTIVSVPVLITEAAGVSSIDVDVGEEHVSVSGPMIDFSIKYSDMSSIELVEDFSRGSRTSGFSDMRISTGTFHNSSLGTYRLASYDACDSMIVVKTNGGSYYAFNQSTAAETQALFDTLNGRIS